MTNHLALIKKRSDVTNIAGVSSRSKNRGAMRRWRSSFGKASRKAAFATNDSGRYWRSGVRQSGGRRAALGPRIKDERCAIGLRLVGGKERIKRVYRSVAVLRAKKFRRAREGGAHRLEASYLAFLFSVSIRSLAAGPEGRILAGDQLAVGDRMNAPVLDLGKGGTEAHQFVLDKEGRHLRQS